MEERKVRVAITQGDTNGIGYELIFRTFAAPELLELCSPVVYGSPKVAAYHRNALNMEANFTIISKAEEARDGRVNLLACVDDEVKVELGTATKESATAGVKALKRAVADVKAGLCDVLVTAPLDRSEAAGFSGHQAFLEKTLGEEGKSISLLLTESLRMAFLTSDIALKEVAAKVTEENIVTTVTRLFEVLRRDWRFSNPRVAVMALNPNADGAEEQNTIVPALKQLEENRVNVFGPYAAVDFFGMGHYDAFDGVLAMYHDQGMAPLKALADDRAVRLLTGLSVVVTEPALSPFANTAQTELSEAPMRQAIYAAIDVWRNRQTYDAPMANPLPKLYHEKRDESEKVRFSIPKKHENSIKERL